MNRLRLTIDHGNTRLKATVYSGEVPVDTLILAATDHDTLLDMAARHDLYSAIYASTAGVDVRLAETLQRLMPGGCVLLTGMTPVPLNIEYSGRETLGADRIAAAVGGRANEQAYGMLVVDAGTCITLDVLTGDTFRGGNISPGISLRFKAMHEFSGSLPSVSLPSSGLPDCTFGHDTQSALQCGVFNGVTAEIAAAFRSASAEYGVTKLLLTGGDAVILEASLRKIGLPVVLYDSLVTTGLLKILLYNESI